MRESWSECERENLEGSSWISSMHVHVHTCLHTHTHMHTHQAQELRGQGQLSSRLSPSAHCEEVCRDKATIQPCCLDSCGLTLGKEDVVKRKIKTTRRKIFKCLFIILSGLFKMNSIYGNEPLNEAI